MPWKGSTSLDSVWHGVGRLLQRWHSLIFTRLRIQGQATQFLSNSVPSITIPSLKSLHIDCINADYAAALFATLCTPSISSLILENMDKDTYAAFGRHLQHIPRYPMLQFIGFICADCMADDLGLISLLPTVTHLALHHVSNFVEQLSATSSLPGGNLVMPHLRTVTFLEPCYGTSILASICKLISIRKSIDLPIDTLRLAPHWNPSDPSINWLRENVILEIEDCEITSALLPYVYWFQPLFMLNFPSIHKAILPDINANAISQHKHRQGINLCSPDCIWGNCNVVQSQVA